MSVKVAILDFARDDIRELRTYVVSKFGKAKWEAGYKDMKDAFDLIGLYSLSGQVPDELAVLSLTRYRQVICGLNRIIYELIGDTAYVHIICDTRKDLRALLLQRILRTK